MKAGHRGKKTRARQGGEFSKPKGRLRFHMGRTSLEYHTLIEFLQKLKSFASLERMRNISWHAPAAKQSSIHQ